MSHLVGSNAVMGFFQELGCTVETPGDGSFWTWIAGTRGRHCVRVIVPPDEAHALVHVFAPLRVSAERHAAVGLLLCHLNAAEHPACFELDCDGELRCRAQADPGRRGLSIRRVREAVFAAVRAMDNHLCRIEAVVSGIEPAAFTRA
jgi:hypothetical protein